MKNTKYGVCTLYLYIGGIIMAAIIHECTVCGKKKICFYRNEEKNVYVCGDCIGTLYSGLKVKIKDSPEDEYARKLLEKYDNRIKKIEKDKSNPQYIQTHIGVGYRMLRVDEKTEVS